MNGWDGNDRQADTRCCKKCKPEALHSAARHRCIFVLCSKPGGPSGHRRCLKRDNTHLTCDYVQSDNHFPSGHRSDYVPLHSVNKECVCRTGTMRIQRRMSVGEWAEGSKGPHTPHMVSPPPPCHSHRTPEAETS